MVDARILNQFDVSTGHKSVIQKGNVGETYDYGLQLWRDQLDTYVFRGTRGNLTNLVLKLVGQAAGHTQTWEFSGESGKWFMGVKPTKEHWAKQIARVDIRSLKASKTYDSNTAFPRIAYLDQAGEPKDYCQSPENFKRAEAALSPDYTKMLIATMENDGTGHFVIYNAKMINQALDDTSIDYVDLRDKQKYPCEDSFTISNFDDLMNNSVQGYDLDNAGNIYITSQHKPNMEDHKYYPKMIKKIPYYAHEETSQWEEVGLSAVNISGKGMHSEVESIQIIGENHGYLTVAYHKLVNNKNLTILNRIYEIEWD